MEGEVGEGGTPGARALGQERFQDRSPDSPASQFILIGPEYLLEGKRIGSGGFGDVYKARHRTWGIPVAIKCLRMNRKYGMNSHQIVPFCNNGVDLLDASELLEEAKKMHKAQFEHVLRLYGVTKWSLGNGNPSLGLVIEFVENGSLDKLLEHCKVPWPLRLRFAYEIALGVNYLHNLKPALFHHDLKPANILLNKDYRIKICDFGLAKWRQSTGQINYKCSKIEGTLFYMPPECFNNINARRDVKYDVYSFGIVIWEILTCQKPYKFALNSQHLKLCVEKGDRPNFRDIPADRPESSDVLVDLMKKCWDENPDERPTLLKCVYELEPKQSNEQELRIAIQTLTQQESQCVDGHLDLSTPGYSEDLSVLCEPVEEQNEPINFVESVEEQSEPKRFVEHVQETNFPKWMAAQDTTSQEENVKCPLSIVTSNECMNLAELVNEDWKMLGRSLGLTEGDIRAIDYDYNSDGLIEKAYQVLQKWIQQQGRNANRGKLVFHLKKMKRNDLVMQLTL
ncbi:ankyrin repeat and protein kinase domain-containing protein 1-like [Cetorhinus maximus]